MARVVVSFTALMLAGSIAGAHQVPPPSSATSVASSTGLANQSAPQRIAITIDDLPWVGPAAPDRLGATDKLLKALRDRGAPAIGFVNCGRLRDDEPVAQRWLAAGMQLGNHSNDHRDLNTADPNQWLDDVTRCDATLRTLTGRPVQYFRYPFLHQGPTIERRDAAAALIAKLGNSVAHVSVDNSDWRLARWYGDAVEKNDARRQADIAAAYLEHMTGAVRHFQDVARAKVGRDVSHVLLLHANQLAADHLGEVLDALRASGFTFVTIEEALQDPVYRMKDAYLGTWGCSWLDRIEPPDLKQEWIDEQDRKLQARFE